MNEWLAIRERIMSEQLKRNIETYLKHFQNRFDYIKGLDLAEGNNTLKQVLYASLIDALSRTVSNPEDGNRERFVNIVSNFGGWNHSDKISATHLAALLKKMNSPQFSDLKEFTHKKIDTWFSGRLIGIDEDFDEKDIRNLWPKDVKRVYDNLTIEHIKHKSLFYRYRNTLIHELRKPGHGFPFRENGEPYYHTSTDADTKVQSIELVYPMAFHEFIVQNILNNLNDYYLKDRIDPYACYTFGTYWIESLNK